MLPLLIVVLNPKQKRWTITDENRRKNVLKNCSEKWRTFKKGLTRKIQADEGDPLETWSYLDEADLQIFTQRISSPEFQVLLNFNVS